MDSVTRSETLLPSYRAQARWDLTPEAGLPSMMGELFTPAAYW